MPEISRFLGIVIRMYYSDHAPPHFHAFYGNYSVTIEIDSGVIAGWFPPRALRHVLEWRRLHASDLRADWHRAELGLDLKPIDPLE